jgi:hypothetical protein
LGESRFLNFINKTGQLYDRDELVPSYRLKHGDILVIDEYINSRFHFGISKQPEIKNGSITLIYIVKFIV